MGVIGMSRSYGMTVEITGHDAGKAEVLQAAAEAQWPFGSWVEGSGRLQAYGEDQLCGGAGETQFA
jgi:hypothetical protein